MEKAKVSLRNWQKARLTGFYIDVTVLSREEADQYFKAKAILQEILINWDDNTEKLIGHKLPPHKCDWCGKRSNILHLTPENRITGGDRSNWCYKHFKQNSKGFLTISK